MCEQDVACWLGKDAAWVLHANETKGRQALLILARLGLALPAAPRHALMEPVAVARAQTR